MTWAERLSEWLPQFRSEHPQVSLLAGGVALLHGSTALGVNDPYSDLDVWLLCGADSLRAFDAVSPTRFIPFQVDGKEGHVTIEQIEEFVGRVERCDLPLIAEMRQAVVLSEQAPRATRPIAQAHRPTRILSAPAQQAVPLTPMPRRPAVAVSGRKVGRGGVARVHTLPGVEVDINGVSQIRCSVHHFYAPPAEPCQ